MRTGPDGLLETALREEREKKKKMGLAALAVAVLFCFTLCLRTTKLSLIPPAEEAVNLYYMVRLSISKWTGTAFVFQEKDILAAHPLYEETVGRFRTTVSAFVAGAVLSLAGAVFQSVFRNPIAVPSMLGVTAGVDVGLVASVSVYSTGAAMRVPQTGLMCYAGSFVLLILIIAYGRFLGGRNFSVVEMLIAGSLLTRILTDLVTLVEKTMTEDELVVLQEFMMYGLGLSRHGAALLFFLPLLAGLVPLFLLRFSMNAAAFPQGEAKTMGLNTFWMNAVAVVCATVLSVASLMFVGNIGMVALIVPFLCRAVFGVDFRNQFVSCILFGGGLLLVCRIITVAAFYTKYTRMFTLGTVVTLLTTPLFLLLIRRGRKGWT